MTARRTVLLVPLVTGLLLTAGCGPRPAVPAHGVRDYSPREMASIKALVDTIDDRALIADVTALQNAGTRYAASAGNLRAAGYVAGALRAAGVPDVSFDEFSYFDDETGTYATSRNVIGTRRGARTPERVVIVGAHFDSITRSADDGRTSGLDRDAPSPGADDNATGVAAVLAAARLLAPLRFDCTLRFVAFSAEEAGVLGSAHDAARLAGSHAQVVAMINLDMIGYAARPTEDIDVFANTASAWLLDRVTNNARVYAPGLPIYRIVDDRYDGSDHGPFWTNGYPAICFMDDYYPSSGLYHTPKDTVDTLNRDFFVRCARLAAANVAELAGIELGRVQQPAAAAAGFPRTVDWGKESGRRLLFTLLPEPDQVAVVDVSVPGVSARRTLSLGRIPEETWSQPRGYPAGLARKPASALVYVPSIRLRAAGRESERGTVDVVDAATAVVTARFEVGRYPTSGCFDAAGTLYYQPYWGERHVDVFDTARFTQVARIPVPRPLSKLAVDSRAGLAAGISTETGAIVIIDLTRGRATAVIDTVRAPRDIVLPGDGTALVCASEDGRIERVDLRTGRIVEEIATPPRPVRLALSPARGVLMSLHRTGTQIGLFRVTPGGSPAVAPWTVLDVGDVVADATFAGEDLCYLVGATNRRLFGLVPSTGRTVWAMRAGGPRPTAETERIVFVGR